MKPFTYLLINFGTVIICFLFSFHPKIQFNKEFGRYIFAGLVAATPFLIWDAWFTSIGVWWFNYDYLIGASLWGLPLEEWLFFLFIPFSCLFTYFTLNKLLNLNPFRKLDGALMIFHTIACAIAIYLYSDRIYTVCTAAAVIVFLGYLYLVAKVNFIGKASLVYLLLMPGFISVNGLLTGTGLDSPIVNYNAAEITGFRVLTIPIEDFLYGYLLFLVNLYVFESKVAKKLSFSRAADAS